MWVNGVRRPTQILLSVGSYDKAVAKGMILSYGEKIESTYNY